MQTSQIRELDAAGFEAMVLGSPGPFLVEFSADWCPPCRMMEPVLAELAERLGDRLTIGRLDVDRDPEVTIPYGVLSMPTLILFAGGRPAARMVGFTSAGNVRRWVEQALAAAGG
ncbi:MAG TPA: thioredoxin domain-containing protein [Candidatus Dormibacteraeota bacterium]|jgi:thioredoxin 1